MAEDRSDKRSLRTAALFAGIGGIERGLELAGHETELFCEIDPGARSVLAERFPGVPRHKRVEELSSLPPGIDLITAGFPCQDLSQAGETEGIEGRHSSLVDHVFRLLKQNPVPWVLIENVPFMLQLDEGSGMEYLISEFEKLDYRWAYRVLDTRAFGLPQRRRRVYFLASLEGDPSSLLFDEDAGPVEAGSHEGKACGFYWTEGRRGLGWAVNAVPPIKGGSGVGIPSPPAIWLPNGDIVTPDIRDAERLQGFPADWTEPATEEVRQRHRWKLVGNAVTVDVAEWIGEQLADPPKNGLASRHEALDRNGSWPWAAAGKREQRWSVEISEWPVQRAALPLAEFLAFEPDYLSARATKGFKERLGDSNLNHPPEFMEALESHLALMQEKQAAPAG